VYSPPPPQLLELSDQQIAARIRELKAERNAVILAHNYQLGEVQEIADHVGDSLELSRRAAKAPHDVIVFCGVRFMAETAAILAPEKVVLQPARDADCLMACMVDAAALREKKRAHPGAMVVCYVNTTAEVKAECDICCTSANAAQVVSLVPPEKPVIFVPDQYLGRHVQQQTGRKMILWSGYCPAHVRIQPSDIRALKRRHPEAKVIVHPEAPQPVTALADAVLSTGGMVRFARETEAQEIIVGTEIGMVHRLQRECPEKTFIPATEQAICPDMKMTRLGDVLLSLERMQFRITVPEEIRRRAEQAVQRMIAITESVV